MKKFIIVILLLAVCGALIYFGYPEISKLISGEQTATSSEADTASDISSADNSSKSADKQRVRRGRKSGQHRTALRWR
ncbi:MAG: hypothetical protein ACLTZI_05355 [[Eubacterium] siraeum]